MATRVTSTEVKTIIETQVSGAVIDSHIRVANEVVTTELSGEGFNSERLRSIELYLSAHFTALYSPSEGMAVERAIGTSRDRFEYQGFLGPGLASTRFGGMVLALDTSKKLASLNSAKSSASFNAFGHVPPTT